MAEKIGEAKAWKHKRTHRNEMRDIGFLVVLNWEYLSEQLGELYQISEDCDVHSWLKALGGH